QMRGSGIVITRLRFFFHAEDGIRDSSVTGVQTCALPISRGFPGPAGVQLGQGSLEPEDARRLNPAWWIGKSVHDLREAEAAHAEIGRASGREREGIWVVGGSGGQE